MAHELMAALRRSGVDFVVAPYEADSQLAFLTQVWAALKKIDVDIICTSLCNSFVLQE